MPDVHDVIIIGAGPSGLTAAVYAGRADLEPLVIEGIAAGGQLMLTTDVENFPGFPDGILGPELMMKFREQAERFGAQFLTADVDRVDFSASPFGVW
ncbi:MAG: FAD-dependent oxidoreductase, partial [Acidimicrobiia bacterium]